jgi:hypothetical protein
LLLGLRFLLLFPAVAGTRRYTNERDCGGCRHQEKLPHVVLSFGLASYPEACVLSIRQFQAFLLRDLLREVAHATGFEPVTSAFGGLWFTRHRAEFRALFRLIKAERIRNVP